MRSNVRITIGFTLGAFAFMTAMSHAEIGEDPAGSPFPSVTLGFDPRLVDEECSVDCSHTVDGETGPCVSEWPPAHHIAPSAENEGGTVPPGLHNEFQGGDHEHCVIGSCRHGFSWQGQYIPAKHPDCVVGTFSAESAALLNAMHVLGLSAAVNDVDAALRAAKVLENRLRLADSGQALEVLGCGGRLIAYIPMTQALKEALTRP